MLITMVRDNHKLVKLLFYLVIIVASLLALVYLDSGDKTPTTLKLKSKTRKLTELRSAEKQNECNILHNDITIVTGDFNETSRHETLALYTKLAPILRSLSNPLVGYFEDKDTAGLFLNGRTAKNLQYVTKAHQFHAEETWTHTLLPHFEQAATSNSNTTRSNKHTTAQHMCYQHLKYELLQKALIENPFCTKYFAWIDLSLLTDLTTTTTTTKDDATGGTKDFRLYIPNDLELGRVAFVQLETLSNFSAVDIFKQDKTWVCEDIFFGKTESMALFIEVYMREMLKFLAAGLAGSDRNVLCALNVKGPDQLNIKLQVYDPIAQSDRKCLDLVLLLKQSGDQLAIDS